MRGLLTNLTKRSFDTVTNLQKKTALYDYHVQKLNGKIVPFAGYLLPVQYEGLVKEHIKCRESAVVFDVSHMGQVKLRGKDAVKFVETVSVGDISNLNPGNSTLSVFLTENAGIIDDTIITRLSDHIHMVVNGANKYKDLAHFQAIKDQYFANKDITFEYLEDRPLLAIQGPQATTVPKLDNTLVYVSRTGYTGEDGFEVSIDDKYVNQFMDLLLQDSRISPAGLGARDSLRLEAGLCLHGNDIDENTTPVDAALMWVVRKQPGDTKYIGFDALEARRTAKGLKNERKRVCFEFKGQGIARGHTDVTVPETNQAAGLITSGVFSPLLKKCIGMAYVDKQYTKIGTELNAQVRGKPHAIQIVKSPFVPSKYYKEPKKE